MDETAGNTGQSGRRRTRTLVLIFVLLGVSALITIYYLWPLLKLGYVDSAIITLRTVVAAEKEFAMAHPDRGYACALPDLDTDEMLRGLARSQQRNGYEFELNCPAKKANGVELGFRITARPLHGKMPAYCSDQSGVLKYDEGGSPERCLQSGVPL